MGVGASMRAYAREHENVAEGTRVVGVPPPRSLQRGGDLHLSTAPAGTRGSVCVGAHLCITAGAQSRVKEGRSFQHARPARPFPFVFSPKLSDFRLQ